MKAIKSLLLTTVTASLALGTTSSAATIAFTDLSTELTGNDISGSGSGTTSVTGVNNGSTYTYTVTYSNFDFDGDSANDSFSFDVTVSGVQGSTFSNTGLSSSTVTLGTTGATVAIEAQGGGGNSDSVWVLTSDSAPRYDPGETLIFSVGNFQSTNTDSNFSLEGNFDGFVGGRVSDRAGNGAPSGIFGVGTGLNGYADNAGFDGVLAGGAGQVLHITSSSASGSDSNTGVSNVDFGYTVNAVMIPEPSSALLLGLSAMGLLIRRRA